MYIITDEWQEIYQTDTITEEDLKASRDGIISIIRLFDGRFYYQGDWLQPQKWTN